jgi:hypothetical protein
MKLTTAQSIAHLTLDIFKEKLIRIRDAGFDQVFDRQDEEYTLNDYVLNILQFLRNYIYIFGGKSFFDKNPYLFTDSFSLKKAESLMVELRKWIGARLKKIRSILREKDE